MHTITITNADISIKTGNGACDAYLAMPEGSGKYPCIVLIEEIWGLNEHIKDVANRFAREGFIVLAPELLTADIIEKLNSISADMQDPEKRQAVQPKLREAMQPLKEPVFAQDALSKLKACTDYLVAHAQSNGNVGVVGFCFGGTYGFQLAIHDARIDACVPFYGQTPDPVDSVRSISCPVFALYGENDPGIVPSIPSLEAAMKKYGKDFTYIVYPGAAHAFFNDVGFRYDAGAAKDAWEKVLAFLHKYLEE